ncbi:hypothetical protein [Streptomyces sp. YS415]|uniref:hypothetical protein n=1 Tax=Streptomyces sp. YS415 TaxID=2944806 RepID=UPI002020EE73|nr:hypothetical protein [Streptomyces sp. YS415]MCL7430145.1 hypothetical protein [Streptomyces sp. YS415]
MNELRHAHDTGHRVADAHGRSIDLTATGARSTHDCTCSRAMAGTQSRGHLRGTLVIRLTVILTGGLVVMVLLVVIRDIVITVASTSVTGLIFKALLRPSHRRDR